MSSKIFNKKSLTKNLSLIQCAQFIKKCLVPKTSTRAMTIDAQLRIIKIGFIGAGNMAGAIIKGIVMKKIVTESQIYLSEPKPLILKKWKERKFNAFKENGKVIEEADIIFIAVKPHILPIAIVDAHNSVRNPKKTENKLFVSILAGLTVDTLEKVLSGFKGRRLIRVFPNTPMVVGAGCSIFCAGKSATDGDMDLVYAIVSSIGTCDLIPEFLFNAAGAVSGCGPAFVYLVIEALSDAAVKMGVPRQKATILAAQTVLGAAKLVLESHKHTGTLKDEVCSPGGTTIAGIHALEKAGVRGSFIDAVEAATQRAEQLGKMHG